MVLDGTKVSIYDTEPREGQYFIKFFLFILLFFKMTDSVFVFAHNSTV